MGLSPTASEMVMMFSAGMLLRAIWDWVVRLGMLGEGFDFGWGFAHRLCDPCACVHVSYFAPVA